MDIYNGADKTGELEMYRDGLLTVFEAECRCDEGGIMRLYACSGENTLYLGILEPSAGVWRLRRGFTRNALRDAGFESCDRVLCLREGERLPENGWYEARDAAFFLGDSELRDEVREQKGVLTRVENGKRLLAFPALGTEPFNLEPLFCFAEIKDINGTPYAVFAFNDAGEPEMPDAD